MNKKTMLAGSMIVSLVIIGSGFAADSNSININVNSSKLKLDEVKSLQSNIENQVMEKSILQKEQSMYITSGTYAIKIIKEEVKIDLTDAGYVTVYNTLDKNDKTLTYYFNNMYPGAEYKTTYGIKNIGSGIVKINLDRLNASIEKNTGNFDVKIDNLILCNSNEEEEQVDTAEEYAEIHEGNILRFSETIRCPDTVRENTEYVFKRVLNFFS